MSLFCARMARAPAAQSTGVGMIAILNYDTADTQALHDALSGLGVAHQRVDSLDQLDRAARIILPHGDSFAAMIRDIRDSGYLPVLFRALDQGRPILGIGRGMHLFFDVCYDNGQHTGLGFIPGKVTSPRERAAPNFATATTVAQSQVVQWTRRSVLVHGVPAEAAFHFECDELAEPLDEQMTLAQTTSIPSRAAAVEDGPVFGVHFLPERSGEAGGIILSNFIRAPLR